MSRKSQKIPMRFNVTDDRGKAEAWVVAASAKYGKPFVLLYTTRVGKTGIYTIQPLGRWEYRPGGFGPCRDMRAFGWDIAAPLAPSHPLT